MRLLTLLLVFVSFEVFADNSSLNLNLPSSRGTYQSDRIRAGDIDCSNAIGSATNVEFGVVGILNQSNPYDPMYGTTMPNFESDKFIRDIGVYGKITIPIGAPKERINCNALYKLELEKKEIELQRLRQELVNLKNLQFEGDDNG